MVRNNICPAVTSLRVFWIAAIVIVGIGARRLENDGRDRYDDEPRVQDDIEPIPFNLEELYNLEFYAWPFNGTWISSNEIVYTDTEDGSLVKYNVEKRTISQIVGKSVMAKYDSDYVATFSSDNRFILIGYDVQKKFRRSAHRKYEVFNRWTAQIEKIANGQQILLAKWSTTGSSLIYEQDNDLYYRQMEENGTFIVRRLTTDGIVGTIYNGLLDWVYEEEVMGSGTGVWFSPDGKYLAFASFNDTNVQTASYLYYGTPGDMDYQYPTEVKIKYPKAGTTNPRVSLNLIDLTDANSKIVSLEAPIDSVSTDHILFTVNWLTNSSLSAIWTNRVQNVSVLVAYDTNGKMKELLTLSEPKGWLTVPSKILFANDKLFFTQYQETNTMDGRYNHVTSYDLINGTFLDNEKDLSPFASAVVSLVKIDSTNGKIYYLATAPGDPSQKNLYSTHVDGKERPTCISCSILTPEGNSCKYAEATFSTDASHYALTCSGPDPATVEIYNREHEKVYTWQSNEELRRKLKKRLSYNSQIINIRVNGYVSRAKMLLPADFDANRKYPMIVQVYAGPDTAAIYHSSSYGISAYYATNRSVIWTMIDGRGSAYRGSEMLFEIYKGLGTVEVEDQIAVTKELQAMFPYIDAKRTAIWGWSYGGYATAMVLATDRENIFKCGISVAPVSSWIYYDSIYTERYMRLPTVDDNLAGYNRSDVTRLVEGLRDKKFMLIHGTGDDNVHYQQSMALSKNLEIADIPFEQISYPDEAHSLNGVSPHFYHSLDHFWGECLDLSYAK